MSGYVVDASVAIKWFLPEIHSEAALRVKWLRQRLHVPAFLSLELGNVLAYRRASDFELARRILAFLNPSTPEEVVNQLMYL